MQQKEENPYEILGIDQKASNTDIKNAYFKNVREFTPEKHSDKFKDIRAAYERLRDDKSRAETDTFMLNVPYSEFIIEHPEDDWEYKPKIDLDSVCQRINEEFSDLERTDFRKDFTEIELLNYEDVI